MNHNMKLLFMMILCGVFAGGLTLSLTGCGKLFRRPSPDPTPSSDPIPDSDHGGEKDAGEALYGDPLDFEEIEIHTNDMSAQEKVYRLTKTETGIRLSYYYLTSSWDGDENDSMDHIKPIRELEGDREMLEKLQKLAGGCGIEDWDGFSGYNSDVLDGTSFSFRAKLTDGRVIHASGTNSFPTHFRAFCDEIGELMTSSPVNSTQFHGQGFTMTVPESWVNRVTLFYGDGYYAFTLPGESGNAYILRVDLGEQGYTDSGEGEDIRVCRLISEEEKLFLTFHLYGNLGMPREQLTEEQLAIYDSLAEELPGIMESVESADGYRKEAEDGSIFYESDAHTLLDDTRSLCLRLYLAGEYAGGVSATEIDGKEYIPFSPAREYPAVGSVEELRTRMLAVFTPEWTERQLDALQKEQGILVKDDILYVRYNTIQNTGEYGGYCLSDVKQMDAEHARITVTVRKATPEDELYRYSGSEDFQYQVERNSEGKWVFADFVYWDK